MLFLDILAEFLTEDLLYNKVKDYLAIRKGELKDAAFEKFYKTLAVRFIRTQKGLDQDQAKKFFEHNNTFDGVLAYLYRFTDPDPIIRDKTKAALCRWADHFKITGDPKFTNTRLVEYFLGELETELRRDANKSLLPYFAEIRGDIAAVKEEIKSFREQFEIYAAEQKARAERATQIDPTGEQLTVDGKLVYASTQKVEPSPTLPIIRCELEAIDEESHKYRTFITNESGKELHKHNFTLKPDDAFLLEANHFLENDGLRDYSTQIKLESDLTFTKRLGNYFYSLIMGANGALRDKVNGVLEKGFQFVLNLDTEAELLWQVPWEYLHDSEEFVGLSGKVHIVRAPKGFGRVPGSAIASPLKILVVVSNPGGEGEFDSERALAAIQEAVDYGRRMGWVELDYLEDATFANFQNRLAAFKPHVVHYIGHGGRRVASSAGESQQAGETYLAFQNEEGAMAPLWGKDLKRLLADAPSVQLLVLSGCMTGQTAFTDALAGVGTALLREQLPALVVMQYSVLVDTAIQFAKVFYEQIGRGESVSHALTHVRQVLAKSRGEHRADWGIPALYLRLPQLQLVDPRAPRRSLSNVEGSRAEGESVNIGDLPVVRDFVGRTRELRRLREAVRHPQQPVIYVWGLGGIGKTSLTAKLIEKLEQDRAIESRLVIRCDNIEPTFASVAEKLGTFISLQGKAGHAEAGLALQDSRYDIETRVSLLNQAIKERRYLIVFDNFESLFSEKAPQVGRVADTSLQEFFMALFSHNWRSTFLFTSRYQWDLLTEEPGMNRYRCGLPLANCLLLHLHGLSPWQTRLLMDNMPNLKQLTYGQKSQLLPMLFGHPWYVHLFDVYLAQHGLDAVLQDKKIFFLSVKADVQIHLFEKLGEYFLDELWSRLNDVGKDALGLFSVFRISLTEIGLMKLISDSKALQTLLNYSLIQRESREDKQGFSYQVLPVVRSYVESKLGPEKMRDYHLLAVEFYVSGHEDYLLEFFKANNLTNVPRNKYRKWLAQIAKLAAQRGQTQLAKLLTTSLLEMHHHLFAVGEYEQAFEMIYSLCYFFNMLGRREVAKALLRQSIASLKNGNKYVAKTNLATLLNEEGKWREALATYQESIDYFESIGDEGKSNLAVITSQQAQIYQERGEYEKALELERQALKIHEEINEKNMLALHHFHIALLLHAMKSYDEALVTSEQALDKVRAINNPQYEAACLHQLGMTLTSLNRPREAFARFQESLEIAEKIGDRTGQANTLGEMGKLLRDVGQFEAAMNSFQKAIAIFYELNDPIKVATALQAIGFIFELQGHFSEALEKYQEALLLFKQYSHAGDVAGTESNIARVKGKMKSQ